MYFPELLEEYKVLLKGMKSEGVTSGSMYQEVKQAIEWMETGYDPAEYRAATRVDAFPMDPYHMQTYVSYLNEEDELLLPEFLQTVRKKVISDFWWEAFNPQPMYANEFVAKYFNDFEWLSEKALYNKERIKDALAGLTDNEKAVFVAIKGEKMTYRKVAQMLGVQKSSVEAYLKRAIAKIERNKTGVQADLFAGLEIA